MHTEDNDKAWELVRRLEQELREMEMWNRCAWGTVSIILVLMYLHFSIGHGWD
jgi:hypothetical protein